jgi:hypothetical protein
MSIDKDHIHAMQRLARQNLNVLADKVANALGRQRFANKSRDTIKPRPGKVLEAWQVAISGDCDQLPLLEKNKIRLNCFPNAYASLSVLPNARRFAFQQLEQKPALICQETASSW